MEGSASVIAREQLQELRAGGVGRESNIVSPLVETVTRLVVQELLEAEQADFLGGRGAMSAEGRLDAARAAADRLINTYRRDYPAAMACFADDLDALLAIHPVPVRHRIRVPHHQPR